MQRQARGFTLVELVTVIALVGALAVFAMPRLLDLSAWRLRAYADELAAQTLAMQRLALAQRRAVVATITGSGVAFAYAGGGTLVTLDCPALATPCIAEGGSRSATFNHAASGATLTSTGSALPITLSHGGTSIAYWLENDSGLLRTGP